MAEADSLTQPPRSGAFAPLREKTFRSIWSASLFSNFAQLILGVGAAWEMTRLTNDPAMVALVQTAMMLPLVLITVPAGAIADMFDRRRTVMVGISICIVNAVLLASLTSLGLSSPWVILAFCSLIGVGVAFFTPAWQTSIRDQVPPDLLPAAIGLGAVSYNIARSIGPALGGVIVVAAGAKAAFGVASVAYLPLLFAFLLWRRGQVMPSRLPPERIDRAMVSGARYARHSPSIRLVMLRAFLFSGAMASYSPLAPLIARNLLGGTASMFGLLLCAGGLGAVVGALMIGRAREKPGAEITTRLCTLTGAATLIMVGLSHNAWLTGLCFFILGGTNIMMISMLNINVQLAAPRWVTARIMSLFTASITAGMALGALLWGKVAASVGVGPAHIFSGATLATTLIVSLLLPLRDRLLNLDARAVAEDPEVALDISLRSGPVVIEMDYRVDPDFARNFYTAMLDLQRSRKRNGAFAWSISRDVSDPWLWTEKFECPTWGDYLRLRERFTNADLDFFQAVLAFNLFDEPHVRRRLERPFGSVRWRAETPDPKQDDIPYIAP